MPLATKNNALIVKDGKLAENCGCCGGWYCCDSCEFGEMPNSLSVSVSVASAPEFYNWRSVGRFGGSLSESRTFSYYASAIQPATYVLNNTGGGTFLFSNNAMTLSASVAPINANQHPAGIYLEARVFKIIVVTDAGAIDSPPSPIGIEEMRSMLEPTLANPTNRAFLLQSYSPYAWLRYSCNQSCGVSISSFLGSDYKILRSDQTQVASLSVDSTRLFPASLFDFWDLRGFGEPQWTVTRSISLTSAQSLQGTCTRSWPIN